MATGQDDLRARIVDDLVERVTVSACGDEGHEAFLCAFDDEVVYPIKAHLAGTDVVVVKIDYDADYHA